MFTDKAQEIIDKAKDYAFSNGKTELELRTVLTAVTHHMEAEVLLAECFGIVPEKLRALCPELPEPVACPGKLPLAESLRAMLGVAKELADEIPDRFHPGMVSLGHLACAMAMTHEICSFLKLTPTPGGPAKTNIARGAFRFLSASATTSALKTPSIKAWIAWS